MPDGGSGTMTRFERSGFNKNGRHRATTTRLASLPASAQRDHGPLQNAVQIVGPLMSAWIFVAAQDRRARNQIPAPLYVRADRAPHKSRTGSHRRKLKAGDRHFAAAHFGRQHF